MKPAMILSPETPVSEAARIIHEEDLDLLPVGNGDEVTGIVTTREITAVAAEPCKADAMPVDDITNPVMGCCSEDDDLQVALNTMRATGLAQLLVRSREGKTVGAISLADIIGACPDIELSVSPVSKGT